MNADEVFEYLMEHRTGIFKNPNGRIYRFCPCHIACNDDEIFIFYDSISIDNSDGIVVWCNRFNVAVIDCKNWELVEGV